MISKNPQNRLPRLTLTQNGMSATRPAISYQTTIYIESTAK